MQRRRKSQRARLRLGGAATGLLALGAVAAGAFRPAPAEAGHAVVPLPCIVVQRVIVYCTEPIRIDDAALGAKLPFDPTDLLNRENRAVVICRAYGMCGP